MSREHIENEIHSINHPYNGEEYRIKLSIWRDAGIVYDITVYGLLQRKKKNSLFERFILRGGKYGWENLTKYREKAGVEGNTSLGVQSVDSAKDKAKNKCENHYDGFFNPDI